MTGAHGVRSEMRLNGTNTLHLNCYWGSLNFGGSVASSMRRRVCSTYALLPRPARRTLVISTALCSSMASKLLRTPVVQFPYSRTARKVVLPQPSAHWRLSMIRALASQQTLIRRPSDSNKRRIRMIRERDCFSVWRISKAGVCRMIAQWENRWCDGRPTEGWPQRRRFWLISYALTSFKILLHRSNGLSEQRRLVRYIRKVWK
jgi:hypothetical protein